MLEIVNNQLIFDPAFGVPQLDVIDLYPIKNVFMEFKNRV